MLAQPNRSSANKFDVKQEEGLNCLHPFYSQKNQIADMSTQIPEYLSQQTSIIERWFEEQWVKTPPPLYCSVDLRYSGFKLAPVDTNLFPAGFNLLLPESYPACVKAFQEHLNTLQIKAHRILLIPESHTRNLGYLENVSTLIEILSQAGMEVRVGSMIEEIKAPQVITLPSGRSITLFPIQRQDNRLRVEAFEPDLILLNHDLSGGVPALLENLEQPILPPLKAGWSTRLKSEHFQHYYNVTQEFSEAIGMDPWLLFPLFQYCGKVNFMSHGGEDCIEYKASCLLKAIQQKYNEYGISESPFLIVKSDTGTYGMGVMTLRTPEEIHHLNRKERTRMSAGKGGVDIDRVLIQEGVYTSEKEREDQGAAEAVVYMMGKEIVGGFYRLHAERKSDENLNAPGMYFDNARFEILSKTDQPRLYAYQVVARLALLAAAREIKEDA